RRRPLPGAEEGAGPGGDGSLLPDPRGSGPEEEAVDVGAARLAEAADGRGHSAGSAPLQGRDDGDPAALRRSAQERAGRAPVRAARVHVEARRPVTAESSAFRRWRRAATAPKRGVHAE